MFFCFENDNNKKNKIIIIIIIIITKIKKNLIGLRIFREVMRMLKSLKKIHDHLILVMTTL